jgi:hypothetical protein
MGLRGLLFNVRPFRRNRQDESEANHKGGRAMSVFHFKTSLPTRRLEMGEKLDKARAAMLAAPAAVAGSDGTRQTMRVAGLLQRSGLTDEDAWSLLCEYSSRCEPPWDTEVTTGANSLRRLFDSAAQRDGKAAGARASLPSLPRSAAALPVVPVVDALKVAEGLAQGYRAGADTWRAASEAGATVASLYLPGEVVSVVTSAKRNGERLNPDGHGYTIAAEMLARPAEAIRNPSLEAGSWMRPNPVKPGSVGSRDEDTAAWRFVVVESDALDRLTQLALLWRLKSEGLPIAALVDSGSKSFHAWVKVDAANAEAYAQTAGRLLALPLALDKACRNSSRLSRFPGARRGSSVQALLYLAPSVSPLNEDTLARIESIVAGEVARLTPVVEAPTVESVPETAAGAAVESASVASPQGGQPAKADEFMKVRFLFDIERPAAGDESELLKHRFLCRGGGALLIGQTGQGKSSLSMQAMLAFALGRPLFGIQPNGQLKCLLVQAENDDGDLSEARDGAAWSVLGVDDDGEAMELLKRNTLVVSENAKVGSEMFDLLSKRLAIFKPDLLIIDPALSFTEGDTSASRDVGKFLRQQLNPLLSAHRCGCLLIHHTPKPSRERGAVNTSGSAYAGLGSAEWANWARAVLTLEGLGDGRFKLHAPKRGGRLGWKDGEGKPAFFKVLEHSINKGGFAWEEVSGSGAAPADVAGKPVKPGIAQLVELVPASSMISKSALVVKMQAAGFAEKWGRDVLAAALDGGELFEWKLSRPGKKPGVGIARTAQPTEGESADENPY